MPFDYSVPFSTVEISSILSSLPCKAEVQSSFDMNLKIMEHYQSWITQFMILQFPVTLTRTQEEEAAHAFDAVMRKFVSITSRTSNVPRGNAAALERDWSTNAIPPVHLILLWLQNLSKLGDPDDPDARWMDEVKRDLRMLQSIGVHMTELCVQLQEWTGKWW